MPEVWLHWSELAAHYVVAQGLTESGGSNGLKGVLDWLTPVLISAVVLVACWRAFKEYLSATGQKGESGAPETHGKTQVNHLLNASVTVAGIVVGGVVINWLSGMLIGAIM